MTSAVAILPGQQLAALNEAYRKDVARKRLRFALGAAVFLAALVVAAFGAEVNLRTFFTYLGNFISYFDRIGKLDTGARVWTEDRKSTRLNSSHMSISYAVFCLKKKRRRGVYAGAFFQPPV